MDRLSVRKLIRCSIEGESGNETFDAQGFDMSEHGISFVTERKLPVNSELLLRYRLDDDGPMITARVRICRNAAGRYGAMFLEKKLASEKS